MDIIVDANILFSVLIKSGKTEELIFEPSLCLFAPEFIFDEFAKYEQLILEKTGRNKKEFDRLLKILKKRIEAIPTEEVFLQKARKISPDPDDIEYFALALKFKCPIWSNDKRLKKQSDVIVYSTHELLRIFG